MTYALLVPLLSLSLTGAALAQIAASEKDRQDALRHYRAGEEALLQEAFDRAEQEFQQAADLDPHLELAPYGLGQVYMATRRYDAAVGAFLRTREVFEANAVNALQDETAAQQRIRDRITSLEDARNAFETGIARSLNTFATIQRLDMQIRHLQFQMHRKSRQPEPVPAWISIALGGAYFRSNAMAEAEREYRAALAVDPGLGEAHNNLAVVLMLTRRYAEAAEELKAAEDAGVRVNPQFKEDLRKALAKD